MSPIGLILLIIVVLMLFGALPTLGFGYNQNWGYAPSGVLGLIMIIVLILFLMGRI